MRIEKSKENQHFLNELKRQFSIRFVVFFMIVLLLLGTPLLIVVGKVSYDPKEFANTYISTVLCSFLIALVLQFLEARRLSAGLYSRLRTIACSMQLLLQEMRADLGENDVAFDGHKILLEHYRVSLLQVFVSDHETNKLVLHIHGSSELNYICESESKGSKFPEGKRRILIQNIDKLLDQVNDLIAKI